MSMIQPEKNEPDPPIRVMLVDDHPIVREGLAAILQRRGIDIVAEACDGDEAVQMYGQTRPDVALMDLRMPKLSGVDAIAAIRRQYPDAKILVLTTYDTDHDIYSAMRAGARGYILKDCPRDQLLEAIRTVQSGETYLPSHVARKLTESMISQDLSPREKEVLQLIAEGKSNQQIGAALFISEGTVKGHVVNLLAKLDAQDRTHAVTNAIRRGILHIDSC